MTVDDIKKYKDSLYSALSRDLADFEKNFLLIAAGILTFSVTFIKDIVSISESIYIGLLFAGWLFMAVSVGLMMFTFINSAYACDKIMNHVDQFVEDGGLSDNGPVPIEIEKRLKTGTRQIYRDAKTSLKKMRFAAIIIFLSGFIIFGGFIGINLNVENKSAKGAGVAIKFNRYTNEMLINGLKVNLTDSTIILKK